MVKAEEMLTFFFDEQIKVEIADMNQPGID